MARQISLTESDLSVITNRFKEMSENYKKQKFLDENRLEFKFTLPEIDKKAQLIFTPKAWAKMWGLIDAFTTEVGWNGVVTREAPDVFLVEDILVFPQIVTGVTFNTDQDKYEQWLNDLDDETACKLCFHGHSHVKMGCSPSGVDIGNRKDILSLVGTPSGDADIFYIFFIANKMREFTGQIFDFKNNVIYDTSDIEVRMRVQDDAFLDDFIDKAKEVAKEKEATHGSEITNNLKKMFTPKKSNQTITLNSYYGDYLGGGFDEL